MEYYSAIKSEEIMNFVHKWMELENIVSEVTQTQKDIHAMDSLIREISPKAQNTQDTTHRPYKV
jgi:peptidoglycan hydrolase CwlO-like protein